MEDLTQIAEGTTTKFIKDLNDNFGKIKNQFDAANNFIFAEGTCTEGTVTWLYRLHTNGTSECWCTCPVTFFKELWLSWQSSNSGNSTGLYYNTGATSGTISSFDTSVFYPRNLEIRNLDDKLKEDIGLNSELFDGSQERLYQLFVKSAKPKCFVTINDYTGNAMLFTTNRPNKEADDDVWYYSPEIQAVYYDTLKTDRKIAVNYYVIGRWK